MIARAWAWLADAEGSTRVAGLLRIGLAALLFARFGDNLALWSRPRDPVWLATGMAFYALTPLLFAGLWTRVVAPATGVFAAWLLYGMGYGLGHEEFVHHHVRLLLWAVMLLAFMPAGRSYSVDRWRARRNGRALPERGPLWAQRLLALQVSALYLFGAWDKMTWAYLSGARLEHITMLFYTGADLPSFPGARALYFVSGMGSTLLEFALGFGLFVRRWQLPLIVLGIAFHTLIAATMPVVTFSATVCFLYLCFLDPDEVEELLR